MSIIDTARAVLGRKKLTIDELRAKAEKIGADLQSCETEIAALHDIRTLHAVAATEGDAEAQAAIDRAIKAAPPLQNRVETLKLARDHWRRQLAAAEAEERAAARAREVEAHRNLLARYAEAVRQAEDALVKLGPAVALVLKLEPEAMQSFHRLGGRAPDGKTYPYKDRLLWITARMADRLASVGVPEGVLGAMRLGGLYSPGPSGKAFDEMQLAAIREYEIAK